MCHKKKKTLFDVNKCINTIICKKWLHKYSYGFSQPDYTIHLAGRGGLTGCKRAVHCRVENVSKNGIGHLVKDRGLLIGGRGFESDQKTKQKHLLFAKNGCTEIIMVSVSQTTPYT